MIKPSTISQEISKQNEAEKSELLSQIQVLQKEISCLSSSSLTREKESIRKDLVKTNAKLRDTESKLKNAIQEKTKLEVLYDPSSVLVTYCFHLQNEHFLLGRVKKHVQKGKTNYCVVRRQFLSAISANMIQLLAKSVIQSLTGARICSIQREEGVLQ